MKMHACVHPPVNQTSWKAWACAWMSQPSCARSPTCEGRRQHPRPGAPWPSRRPTPQPPVGDVLVQDSLEDGREGGGFPFLLYARTSSSSQSNPWNVTATEACMRSWASCWPTQPAHGGPRMYPWMSVRAIGGVVGHVTQQKQTFLFPLLWGPMRVFFLVFFF